MVLAGDGDLAPVPSEAMKNRSFSSFKRDGPNIDFQIENMVDLAILSKGCGCMLRSV
uniref:Uncharacterized protein n=1 Tax=Arundo donax TaxID=35708 RepID=A0A0A9BC90_ARUDO